MFSFFTYTFFSVPPMSLIQTCLAFFAPTLADDAVADAEDASGRDAIFYILETTPMKTQIMLMREVLVQGSVPSTTLLRTFARHFARFGESLSFERSELQTSSLALSLMSSECA